MNPSGSPTLMVAVITGGHHFEVPAFDRLFRGMDGIDPYLQTLENFSEDLEGVRDQYDALVFYNMHAESPTPKARAFLETLGDRPQGLVFLHHGILAYRGESLLGEVLGLPDRSFNFSPGYAGGERVKVQIACEHPITRGLAPWTMVDEIYGMASAGNDSQVVLTTDHPTSMKSLAWTRQHGKARVFAFASGHGKETYADPNFQTVLRRGIQWAAGKI